MVLRTTGSGPGPRGMTAWVEARELRWMRAGARARCRVMEEMGGDSGGQTPCPSAALAVGPGTASSVCKLMGKTQTGAAKTPPLKMEVPSRSRSDCCREKYGVTYLLPSLTWC